MTTVRHLPIAPHLTCRNARHERTFCGQAYFAGTGPEGKTCGACAYWRGKPHDKRCVKFPQTKGGRIPSYAAACKYFDEVAG